MLPMRNTRLPYDLPIRIHGSGRYFEDQRGRPFFWHGDTSWKLFWDFSTEEAAEYLEDRANQGFTVIQVQLLPHRFYQANRNGDEAFLSRGDLRTPNPAYFSHVDKIIEMAAKNSLLLVISPAWLSSWEQDWFKAFVRPMAEEFAGFLAERYGGNPNILGWIHGGDDDAIALHDAVHAAGQVFKEKAPRQFNTFHACVKGGWTYFAQASWYDFHMAYAYVYEDFLAQIEAVSQLEEKKPFVLGETHYEGNAGISSETVRRYAYTAILSGGAGHTYGHKDIWCKTCFWNWALCSEASHHMRVLRDVAEMVNWPSIYPVDGKAAVYGASSLRFPTAASDKLRVAYVYDNDFITVSPSSSEDRASWIDPVSGGIYTVKAEKEAIARIPGRNAGGSRDWILVLSAE